MKRALFVMLPEVGHIRPTVTVAKRLQQSGISVSYYSSANFEPFLSSSGFDVKLYTNSDGRSDDSRTSTIAQFRNGRSIWLDSWGSGSGSRREQFLEQLGRVIDASDPNLIIVDWSLRGLLTNLLDSGNVRCPAMFLSTSLINWDEQGYPGDRVCVVLCPEELEVPAFRNRWDFVRYAEPGIDLDAHIDEKLSCRTDRPFILSTFGSQSSLHPNLLERLETLVVAASKEQWADFLIVTGSHPSIVKRTSHLPLPRNVAVRPFVEQAEELRRANIFITHGGLGGIKESIMHGVPMIVLPAVFDQPFNAKRVQKLGLGECLFPERVNVDVIRHSLRSVASSTEYLSNLLHMRQVFVANQRRAPAASIIRQILETGCYDTR